MSSDERLKLIGDLGAELKARVLVYFCGDRPTTPARLGTDVLRSIYAQVTHMPTRKGRLVVFLYGIGGHVNSAWKIATLLREFCEELHVLVPYKAHSAATLLALGSDKTIMSQMASLSPFDPIMEIGDVPISVHDVLAYAKLAHALAFESPDQAKASVVTGMLSNLMEEGSPLILGQAYRLYRHVQMVAGQLLDLHRPDYTEDARKAILRTLVEKGCLHSHVIRRSEARKIGLDVEDADDELCRLSWDLCQQYMDLLALDSPTDIDSLLPPDDERLVVERFPVAILESTHRCHAYRGTLQVTRRRDLSALKDVKIDPEVLLNVGTLVPDTAGELLRQLEQASKVSIAQQLKQLAETESEAHLRGARWEDLTEERSRGENLGVFWGSGRGGRL